MKCCQFSHTFGTRMQTAQVKLYANLSRHALGNSVCTCSFFLPEQVLGIELGVGRLEFCGLFWDRRSNEKEATFTCRLSCVFLPSPMPRRVSKCQDRLIRLKLSYPIRSLGVKGSAKRFFVAWLAPLPRGEELGSDTTCTRVFGLVWLRRFNTRYVFL